MAFHDPATPVRTSVLGDSALALYGRILLARAPLGSVWRIATRASGQGGWRKHRFEIKVECLHHGANAVIVAILGRRQPIEAVK